MGVAVLRIEPGCKGQNPSTNARIAALCVHGGEPVEGAQKLRIDSQRIDQFVDGFLPLAFCFRSSIALLNTCFSILAEVPGHTL